MPRINPRQQVRNLHTLFSEFTELDGTRADFPPERWREIHSIFMDYIALIESTINISPDDLEVIKQASILINLQNAEKGKRSETNTLDLLALLSRLEINDLSEIMRASFNQEAPFHLEAMNQMMRMMRNAQELKAKGIKPQDGDRLADEAIWGYTQINYTRAQVHFLICHYLERYFVAILRKKGIYLPRDKDFFLGALTPIVILKFIRYINSPNQKLGEMPEILTLWVNPKANGGLGWVEEADLKVYLDLLMPVEA